MIVGGRITILFDIMSYCKEDAEKTRMIAALNEWLLSYKNCEKTYAIN